MLFLFILRIVGGALDQKGIVRHQHRLRLSRTDFFPLIFPKIAVYGQFQLRGLLPPVPCPARF